MKRFHLALASRDRTFLRREARRRRTSMAAVVRTLIEDRTRARGRILRDHPFRDIIGIGRGDGSPVSERHDECLYGLSRRKY
jgi:hypothetical protein